MLYSNIESVLIISDVSVGYGTPQVLSITNSLCKHYGATGYILEPDNADKPPLDDYGLDNITVERLYTCTNPYSLSGRYEYCLQAAERIDRLKPDIVIISSFVGSGALVAMKHKPRLTIYYGIEHSDGNMPREIDLMQVVSDKIDLSIYPEENRALLDAPRLNLRKTPTLILYNGSSADIKPKPVKDRNGRFFYGGAIHKERTFSDRYLCGPFDDFPIDLYGMIDGYPSSEHVLSEMQKRNSNVSYKGFVKGGKPFLETASNYQFSIIAWNPISESFHYAAPNKFFDAIAAGIPPLTGPHPLCKRLVDRYDCGLVMKDWSEEAMIKTFKEAQVLLGTDEYTEMVEKNLMIARQDLNWDAQFEKLANYLDSAA